MQSLPPLSLYVHLPWCIRKCPYCDFNSHATKPGTDLPESDYLQALLRDIAILSREAQGRRISSIFFGGGTPSLFSAKSIGAILTAADQHAGLSKDCEITLEANPGTAEQTRFSGYRAAGVNRLSIGIQSFDRKQLTRLGRIHSSEEAVSALHLARHAGFENLNLDLMYGLPHQTQAQALEDLQQAVILKPEHISWYELTIEPNTEFFSRPPPQPDNDELAEFAEAGIELLATNGYQRYEISAFARSGRRSQHNLNYWRFGDYLGIGAGAHSKISHIDNEAFIIQRQHRTRLPEHYMNRIGSAVAGEHEIDGTDLLGEYMMNALRLVEGFDVTECLQRTGISLEYLTSACEAPLNRGLISWQHDRIRPTEQGMNLLNICLEYFLPD